MSSHRSEKGPRYVQFKNIANLHHFDFGDLVRENATETDAAAMRALRQLGRGVVLMIFSDDCGHCTLADPDYLKLAKKYPAFSFFRENVSSEISENVKSLPTFRVFPPNAENVVELVTPDMIALEDAIRTSANRSK